jgi:hypothetical protein
MTKNIDKLIQFLRDETVAFSMDYWTQHYTPESVEEYISRSHIGQDEFDKTHACGTVACIGGSAALMMAKEMDPSISYIMIEDALNYDDAFDWIIDGLPNSSNLKYNPKDLFEPFLEDASFSASSYEEDFIDRERAIRVLEHLRDTGEIDWTV